MKVCRSKLNVSWRTLVNFYMTEPFELGIETVSNVGVRLKLFVLAQWW